MFVVVVVVVAVAVAAVVSVFAFVCIFGVVALGCISFLPHWTYSIAVALVSLSFLLISFCFIYNRIFSKKMHVVFTIYTGRFGHST